MKKVIVGVTLALAVVTSSAAADGIDRRPPPSIAAPDAYGPPPSWSGFYVGAGIGGGAMIHDVSVRDDVGSLFHFDGIGGDGVFGTAIVGWDWQISPTSVFGVFVDYDFSNINTDASALDGTVRAGIDHDHSWSVGARLGVLSSPSTLWYATGGYTEARFETFASIDGVGSISDDRTFRGWFAGGGVDTRLAASNWFLRLEYRFTQFDDKREFLDEVTSVDVEPSMHTARLTLAYKFNSGGYGWAPGSWRWGQ
jgi:outer membrane immunogenic protein